MKTQFQVVLHAGNLYFSAISKGREFLFSIINAYWFNFKDYKENIEIVRNGELFDRADVGSVRFSDEKFEGLRKIKTKEESSCFFEIKASELQEKDVAIAETFCPPRNLSDHIFMMLSSKFEEIEGKKVAVRQ